SPPRLVYIVQGRGIIGTVFLGCLETFPSFQQPKQIWEQETGKECQRFRYEHQMIHCHEGDIIALPARVTYWSYNNAEDSATVVAITVTVFDT
ncbi:unnamed protein product, partial [Musa banksii]